MSNSLPDTVRHDGSSFCGTLATAAALRHRFRSCTPSQCDEAPDRTRPHIIGIEADSPMWTMLDGTAQGPQKSALGQLQGGKSAVLAPGQGLDAIYGPHSAVGPFCGGPFSAHSLKRIFDRRVSPGDYHGKPPHPEVPSNLPDPSAVQRWKAFRWIEGDRYTRFDMD